MFLQNLGIHYSTKRFKSERDHCQISVHSVDSIYSLLLNCKLAAYITMNSPIQYHLNIPGR